MTTSQRLKLAVIAAIDEAKPDELISVVDSQSRSDIVLPVIAVSIDSATAFNEALQVVGEIGVTATLRVHAGDDDEETTGEWIDTIESQFSDGDQIIAAATELLQIYSWVYQGSTQQWDENILEVRFSATSLCARLPEI
jgi:hypothetical protein